MEQSQRETEWTCDRRGVTLRMAYVGCRGFWRGRPRRMRLATFSAAWTTFP